MNPIEKYVNKAEEALEKKDNSQTKNLRENTKMRLVRRLILMRQLGRR
jgi:hypothetical protein